MRRRRKERGPRGNETGQLTAHRETGVGSLRYIWVPIYAHIQTQKAKRGAALEPLIEGAGGVTARGVRGEG